MKEPSPELEEQVRLSFSRQFPQRVFTGCKVAEAGSELVVRIYSRDSKGPPFVIPTPYEIFRFDPQTGDLGLLSGKDAAPFLIANYK